MHGLEQDTNGENLHLLIHDEAHWGIKKDTLLERFFVRLCEIMELHTVNSHCKPKLLVLLVSATPGVLSHGVPGFAHATHAVNWQNLSQQAPYLAPKYRSIDELDYRNDDYAGASLASVRSQPTLLNCVEDIERLETDLKSVSVDTLAGCCLRNGIDTTRLKKQALRDVLKAHRHTLSFDPVQVNMIEQYDDMNKLALIASCQKYNLSMQGSINKPDLITILKDFRATGDTCAWKAASITYRSAFVMDEYKRAITAIKSKIERSTNAVYSTCGSFSEWGLIRLFGTGFEGRVCSNETLQQYQAGHYRNQMVFLRLSSVAEVTELVEHIRTTFANELPFEIITLREKIFRDELSSKAQSYTSANCVASMDDIPVLVVVVDKIQMGVRIPPSYTFFDARVTYCGDYLNVRSSHATHFEQDVGRCAGHKKVEANSTQRDYGNPMICLALTNSQNHYGPPKFQNYHPLLDEDNRPKVGHTEFSSPAGKALPEGQHVYTRLIDYSVLLDATPQIGKTGSFMSLIESLFLQHIVGKAFVPDIPEGGGLFTGKVREEISVLPSTSFFFNQQFR